MTDRATALRAEIEYWRSIASGEHRLKERVEAFRKRAIGEMNFPDYIMPYLREGAKILDVGAGPHTTLGKPRVALPGVELVAIDPLATAFQKLLAQYNFTPKTPTIYGDAEKLISQFGESAFDLVYCRNALDHVENPESAINQMLGVCKAGGFIFFEGSINEGINEQYRQLHKWNFLPVDDGGRGDCVIWNAEYAKMVSAIVGCRGRVSVWRTSWYKVEIERCSE